VSPLPPSADPRATRARRKFERLVARPDPEIDLAEAALWIAAESRPELDVAAALRDLDALAERARSAVDSADDEEARVHALNRVLFEQEGFHGNRDDYYEPENSDLGRVLERRTGIPITLSIVYVEVAQRLGLHSTGVGFPGHYLAKVVGAREIIVDAFEGRVVDETECGERLRAAMGPDAHFDRGWLRAATHKETLARMLSNLKQIHIGAGDAARALACCDRILLLAPDAPLEIRDRGLLYAELEAYRAADEDLTRFLSLAPGHPSAAAVQRKLEQVRRRVRSLH
jgi:regulator of sirC expression with transglutaminase-like and TPR domain